MKYISPGPIRDSSEYYFLDNLFWFHIMAGILYIWRTVMWVMRFRKSLDCPYTYINEARMRGMASAEWNWHLENATRYDSVEEALEDHRKGMTAFTAVKATSMDPDELGAWVPVPIERAELDDILLRVE